MDPITYIMLGTLVLAGLAFALSVAARLSSLTRREAPHALLGHNFRRQRFRAARQLGADGRSLPRGFPAQLHPDHLCPVSAVGHLSVVPRIASEASSREVATARGKDSARCALKGCRALLFLAKIDMHYSIVDKSKGSPVRIHGKNL